MTRGGLLFPDLSPEDAADGWQPDVPTVTAAQVLAAIAKRHPMDGFNGEPGRWVFATEVPEATGGFGAGQRFDALAIGLVPSVKYARVVYEVKVSRGDWLRELRPKIRIRRPDGAWIPVASRAEGERYMAGSWSGAWRHGTIEEYPKWEAALAVSTEYFIAAPPRVVQLHELPAEAGLVEVRMWGGELRARVVRPAPVRDTPTPGPEFWAVMLRKAARVPEAAA